MEETDNWKNDKIFQEVSNQGQRTISFRWVVKKKNISKRGVCKSRLVARGFEETEEDSIRKDSPTC